MSLGSIRIGRLAGIPIGVQPLWLLIVGLITWSLGAAYYPEQVTGIAPAAAYGLGLLSALLLFASILLHELGHAVVARRHGVEIEEIDLWLLGGVARMGGYPKTAGSRAALRARRPRGDPGDRRRLRRARRSRCPARRRRRCGRSSSTRHSSTWRSSSSTSCRPSRSTAGASLGR